MLPSRAASPSIWGIEITMSRWWRKLRNLAQIPWTLVRHPVYSVRFLSYLPFTVRAMRFCSSWRDTAPAAKPDASATENPLRAYFDDHLQGPGIFKWLHYFDFYHRHLKKFVGKDVHVLEIGIYSGGSIEMWQAYFGPSCRISGVDIEPACRAYASERVQVFIGDQADRDFWASFRESAPIVDVLIDDGGHRPEQQRITLEEMLPHLQPGGVYICEDIHKRHNGFAAYAAELATALHQYRTHPAERSGEELRSSITPWQADIKAVHIYPFAVVIEKHEAQIKDLVAARHGTEWQTFQ